ncbi:hypothetical protein ACM66B_003324 [Microbotryomycetes sp. NB124-2]
MLGSLGRFGAFIVLETTRAVVTFGFLRSGIPLSSTSIICLSELIKVIVSSLMLLRHRTSFLPPQPPARATTTTTGNDEHDDRPTPTMSPQQETALKCATFAVPATLYLGNNMLYFVGLQLTSPGPLHVAMMARLPFTAVLHHFIIRQQTNWRAWASLTALVIGLAMSEFSQSVSEAFGTSVSAQESTKQLLGTTIGLTIAAVSAFASILTERLLKDTSTPFWTSQFWLYSWGLAFAAVSALSWSGSVATTTQLEPSSTSTATVTATLVCASLAATVGLAAGSILRYLDTIWKLVGNALTLVTIAVATAVAFPKMDNTTLTPSFINGSGLILLATWHYGWAVSAQSQPPQPAGWQKVPSDDRSEDKPVNHPSTSNQQSTVAGSTSVLPSALSYRPTAVRTCAAVSIILICSALFSLQSS